MPYMLRVIKWYTRKGVFVKRYQVHTHVYHRFVFICCERVLGGRAMRKGY